MVCCAPIDVVDRLHYGIQHWNKVKEPIGRGEKLDACFRKEKREFGGGVRAGPAHSVHLK
jgi:hypothetical protein